MNPISAFFFLVPLTLSLSLLPQPTTATLPNATVQTTVTVPTPVGELNSTTTVITRGQNNAPNLIEKACANFPRKTFCLSVLSSAPNSSSADLKGLAFIALKAASKNATDASVLIKTLLNDAVAEPSLDDGLNNCNKAYQDLTDQIDDSVNALVSRAFGDVETWMKAAIADADTCEGGIKGQTAAHAQELSRRNRLVRQLCNVGLSVVHILARTT